MPSTSTSNAPSTVRSTWPPRIMAKDSAELKMEAPVLAVTVCLPALIMVRVQLLLGGEWAHAEQAVFRLQHDLYAFRDIVGDQGGDTDAEIDVVAVLQFTGYPHCQLFT